MSRVKGVALGLALLAGWAGALAAPAAGAVTSIARISVNAQGLRMPGSSTGPYISADGDVTAFTSAADLTENGSASQGVFVRDATTGTLTRIADGTVVGLSSDGRYVAAADGDEQGFHVYDLQDGTSVAIGIPSCCGNTALKYGASLSANGHFFVYASAVPNPNNSNGAHEHILVEDLQTHVLSQIPDPEVNWEWPTISDDGRYIAFQPALASNPVEVLDRDSGQIVFDPSGYTVDNYQTPKISPDGSHVLFGASPAGGGFPGHVYVGTIATGSSTDLTPAEAEVALADGNWDAAGRYVSFSATAPLVSSDSNAKRDVYVYDSATGDVSLASTGVGGAQGDNDSGFVRNHLYGYTASSIDDHANKVVFESAAANLVPDDGTGIPEIESLTTGFGVFYIDRSDVYEASLAAANSLDADLTISAAPADITTPATGPAGAVATYEAPTASDEDGETPTVICDHPSGSTFPVGTTTVTCTATDPDDENSPVSQSFTVTITGAEEQLTELMGAVNGVGPGHSLQEKVAAVQMALGAGERAEACEILRTLVNQVMAQSGKKISPPQANQLIAEAKRIGAVIGC